MSGWRSTTANVPSDPEAGGSGERRRVTVVIVDYHSADQTLECVRSLIGATVDRIVVVDNGGSRENFEALRKLHDITGVEYRLIRSGMNLGFAGGVNFGIRSLEWSPDDVIWLLNPDCIVLPGALAALLECMDETGSDVVTPVVLSGDMPSEIDPQIHGSPIWFGGGKLDLRRGVVKHCHYKEPWWPGKLRSGPVDFVTGAAMAITKGGWDRVGALDERYFLYWEDVDFSLRARELGLEMTVVDDALVWHREGGTATDRGQTYWFYMQRNRLLVLRRFGSGRWPTRLVVAAPETLRLLMRSLRGTHALQNVFSSLSGIAAGLRGRSGVRAPRRRDTGGLVP